MVKRHLICIEGFDRIGKDTIFNKLKECPELKDFEFCSQIKNPDYYREKGYINWIEETLIDNTEYFLSIKNKNIITGRYILSEYAYSSLFNRKTILEEILNKIQKEFYISNIVLFFDSYDEYIHRCSSSLSKVEYTQKEYEQLENFFSDSTKFDINTFKGNEIHLKSIKKYILEKTL